MEDGILIIYIVAAILGIILFFKVWGMCNNVRDIKKQLIQDRDFAAKYKFLMGIGEKERAKELLINRILSNKEMFSGLYDITIDEKINKVYERYGEELKQCGYTIPVEEKKEQSD